MTESEHSVLDLRHFLEFAESKGGSHYLAIDKPISPKWITTAVVAGLARKLRSPTIRFNDVGDSPFPMVTNVCASLDRVAKSVGLNVDALNQQFVDARRKAVAPKTVGRDEAPVFAVRNAISERGLSSLPALFYTATQSSPYLTSAIIVGRDPDSDAHNLSFHRLMIIDNESAAIYMTPGGHLDQIWRKHGARNEVTPIAAVIGTHPLWCYASLIAGELEHDDYAMVGGVLGEPLAVAPMLTDDRVSVPAYAEILLEGFIEPEQTETEGPFGEFLGYDAEQAQQPLVRFTHFSSRKDPLYQDIVAGQIEHLTMSSVSLRARLQRDYFEGVEAVSDFWLPAAMTIFVSVRQPDGDAFDAAALMENLLLNESYLKQAYCFDSDIDLRKQASVQTAIACFVQPDRDIKIYPDCSGNGVDPSETEGKTAKLAVDARAKKNTVRSGLPEQLLGEFDLNDWIR